METFQANTTLENASWSQELPNTVVTGHPYLNHVAVFSLFNKTGSSKKIRIKEILITPYSAVGVTTLGVLELRTISALTGGETITPAKIDSNNASLPAQVSIVKRPATMTTTNQALFRFLVAPKQNTTRVLANLASNFSMHRRIPNSLQRWNDAVTSEYQKITLREGQGLSFNTLSSNYNAQYQISFWVRVVATGACHLVRDVVAVNNLSPFAVLNGSGSGVVLEVFDVQIEEVGDDTIPLLTWEAVDSANLVNGFGEVIVPTAYDSANALSSSIVCYKNANVYTEGQNAGALIAVAQKGRVVGQTSLIGAGVGIGLGVAHKGGNPIFQANYADLEVVLREGKGIAIFARNAGMISNYEIAVTFIEEDLGGATCNYPIEDNVRGGIGYGAGGTEFTGNIVLPAEAEVETGVMYGANGTEFEGTFAGGGGGSEHSFTFVT